MEDIKILGKTIQEISNRYFDSTYFRESYTPEEQKLLKQGFTEGLEYLYPMYETQLRLVKIYEKLENIRDENNRRN